MADDRELKHKLSRREEGDILGAILPSKKILAAMLLVVSVAACRQASHQSQDKSQSAMNSPEPTIEATPIEPSNGQWKIATSDTITLTVTAPGAEKVKFLHQPVIATGRHIELKSLEAPTDRPQGKFSTEFKAQPDFAVGAGRKNFPIVIGGRKATDIIWNPEWIPPNSRWVEESEKVEPGERIEADDPRNPLGKIKIPLGQGYLIHQAAKPSDIGRLVSHGCIRMLTDDIFDLTEKIVAAHKLPITIEQIGQRRASTDRLAVKLDPPLWVDINYDTQVIEGGVLHLYPDVYGHDKQPTVSLRAELEASGVDAQAVSDETLKQIRPL